MTERKILIAIDSSKAESGAQRATRSLQQIRDEAQRASGQVDKTEGSFAKLSNTLSKFKGIAALAGIGSLGAAFTAATAQAVQFDKAMREVYTLISSEKEFNQLQKNVRAVNREFGGGVDRQAKALYQIISAGATDAAQATQILTAANKLAIGGVTDIMVAADGLTSVLNAYGSQVKSAQDVSDSFFVAVRAGKTTVDELSTTIGKVAPLAAASNVSLQELLATVAALTKGGISTAESVTGLRAILAAVAKPTSEATDLAKQLGIQFNSAGLQAKGLKGFLDELMRVTGGNTAMLAQLFGGVEALVPVMALAGQTGKDFAEILKQMEVRTGETDTAFQKMRNSAAQVGAEIKAKLSDELLGLGTTILGAAVPAMQALNNNFDDFIGALEIAAGVGAAFIGVGLTKYLIEYGVVLAQTTRLQLALAAAQGIPTWQAFAALIGGPVIGAVRALTLAIVANPIGLFAAAAAGAVSIFLSWKNSLSEATGTTITLRDVASAAWGVISDALSPLLDKLSKFFGWLKDVKDAAADLFSKAGKWVGMTGDSGALKSFEDRVVAIAKEREALTQSTGTVETHNDAVAKMKEEMEKAAKANAALTASAKASTKAFMDQIKTMDQSLAVLKLQSEGKDKESKLLEAQYQIQSQINRELTPQEIALLRQRIDRQAELNTALDKQKELVEANKKAAEQMEKPFLDAAERIQQGFADAFSNVFSEGLRGFKDFGSQVKAVFSRMLGELATLAIQRQIIIPITTAFAGGMGLSGSSIASALGGGGSAGGGMGGIANGAMSLGRMLGGVSLQGSVAGTLTQFGATRGIGEWLAVNGMGGASLASLGIAGAAGYFGGDMLTNALGMKGEYGGIGGSIGATAGMIVGGPIGALIGGALGSLAGGLIGNNKPSNAYAGANIDLTSGNVTMRNNKTSANIEGREALIKSIQQTREALLQSTGATGVNGLLNIDVGSRDGIQYYLNGARQGVAGVGDFQGALSGITRVMAQQLTGIPDELAQAIKKIDFSDLNQAFSDLQTVTGIVTGSLFEQADATNAAQQSIDAINAQFDALKDKAEEFGVSTVLLEQKRQEALQSLTTGFNQSIEDQIMGFTDPLQKALDDLAKAQQDRLDQAETLGADLVDVERLNQIERNKVIEQYTKQATDNIQSLLDDLKYGDLAQTSPTQRLADIRALFESTAAAAQGGNTDALDQISSIARTFLDASKEVFASSASYKADVEQVTGILQQLLGSTQQFALGGITSGLSFAGEQGPEAVVPLPDGRSIPVSVSLDSGNFVSGIVDELKRLRAAIIELGQQSNEIGEGTRAQITDLASSLRRMSSARPAGGIN